MRFVLLCFSLTSLLLKARSVKSTNIQKPADPRISCEPETKVFNNIYLARFILSFVDNPFTDALFHEVILRETTLFQVLLVNKAFYSIVAERYPPSELAEMTGNALFAKMNQGFELWRFLWLGKNILKGRFPKAFSLNSAILPESHISIKYFLESVDKSKYFNGPRWYPHTLVNHFTKCNNYEILACVHLVFKEYPENSIDRRRLAYYLAQSGDMDTLLSYLTERDVDCFQFLIGALVAPLGTEIFDAIYGPQWQNDYTICVNVLFLIGEISIMQLWDEMSTPCEFLYQRNDAIIDQLENQMMEDHYWYAIRARLLNTIRFAPESITVSAQDVFSLVEEYEHTELSVLGLDLVKDALAAVVCSGRRHALFEEIAEKMPPRNFDDEFMKLIIQHTDLARLLPEFCYMDLGESFTSREILHVSRFKKNLYKTVDDIQNIPNISTRLLITAEIYGLAEFELAVENEIAKHGINDGEAAMLSNSLWHTIMTLLYEFEYPIPFLSAILFRWERLMNCIRFASVLGEEHSVRAMLADTTGTNLLLEKFPKITIHPDFDFIRVLLRDKALAKKIGSEQARPIREHFDTRFLRDAAYKGFSARNFLQLFEIFQIPIKDRSFNVSADGWCPQRNRFTFDVGETVGSMASRVTEPEFLPYLFYSISSSDRSEYWHMSTSINAIEPNPCRMKTFSLLEMWFACNPASFMQFAPPLAVKAFIPRAAEEVFSEILESDVVGPMQERLAEVYLWNVTLQLKLSWDELEELRESIRPEVRALLEKVHFQTSRV